MCHVVSGFSARPLKKLFTANQCWTSFLDTGGLRDIEVEAVTKMLACGTRIAGVKEYACENPGCPHVRWLNLTPAAPFAVAEDVIHPVILLRQLQRVDQAKKIVLCRQFTRTAAPEIIQLMAQSRTNAERPTLVEDPVNIGGHVTREATLLFGKSKPARDEKVFLRFRANQAS